MAFGVWCVESASFTETALGQIERFPSIPAAEASAAVWRAAEPNRTFAVKYIGANGKAYEPTEGATLGVVDLLGERNLEDGR